MALMQVVQLVNETLEMTELTQLQASTAGAAPCVRPLLHGCALRCGGAHALPPQGSA